ncbi:MAG: IMP cyclohydrolase [Christensenellaceae bacterium]|jgi:IMP cyclohydrolase
MKHNTPFAEKADENFLCLQNAAYPGRCLLMGLTPDGQHFVQLYITMGRSENSKKRRLVQEDGVVKTVPLCSEDTMQHKALLIYTIAAQVENNYVVTNGEQTDTILAYLQAGKSFAAALRTWQHENDAPIFTPRISGVYYGGQKKNPYTISLIKPSICSAQASDHFFYEYDDAYAGLGHAVTTYDLDAPQACAPFMGEPFLLPIYNDMEEMAQTYWNAIGAQLRVGLYIRFVHTTEDTVKESWINRPALMA